MTKAARDKNRGQRNSRWRIQDLIDLEYFLHIDDIDAPPDGNDQGSASSQKARDTYLHHLQHLGRGSNANFRRVLIQGWLDIRRESEAAALPGSVYAEVSRITLVVAAVLGIFAGISLAMSLLDYTGTYPLNVSIYMGVAVFAQMLLIVLWVVVFSLRVATRTLAQGSVVLKLMGKMFSAALLRAHRGVIERLDGRKRDAIAAATGLFKGRKRVYGSLFFWPAFILLQVFAVCFNIALLGATLAILSGSDVAFGWQSTFQVSDQVVYHLVQTISLPWRWIVPPSLAYPSLDAIEGSRIVLKEGIQSLSTGDLVSWWPFLCFSVFFYGLLPRLVLMISGLLVQRRLLARLRFDHSACDRLVRTMTNPVVSTAGTPVTPPHPDAGEEPPSALEKKISQLAGGNFVALVPEDISADCDGLEAVAARELSMQVTHRKIIAAGEVEDQQVLDALQAMRDAPNFAGVLVLQEAWQPPIRENLNYLKQLRRRLGERAAIVVGLVGKPRPDTLFTAPREVDFRIWKQRVDAFGDPYLAVERLVAHD